VYYTRRSDMHGEGPLYMALHMHEEGGPMPAVGRQLAILVATRRLPGSSDQQGLRASDMCLVALPHLPLARLVSS
jgi:hypothetical protein